METACEGTDHCMTHPPSQLWLHLTAPHAVSRAVIPVAAAMVLIADNDYVAYMTGRRGNQYRYLERQKVGAIELVASSMRAASAVLPPSLASYGFAAV